MTEQLKLIKVRPGKTGFYTKVLEAGEYGRIPVSIKETKDGWFDDVPEQEDHIAAAKVGRKNESNAKTNSDGGANSGNGAGSIQFSNQVGEEKTDYARSETALVGDAPSGNPENEGAAQSADGDFEKAAESKNQDEADSKGPTKADIIKELEELGAKDFNRSSRKDELQALLDSIKDGLVKE